jgi:hypothetical protein
MNRESVHVHDSAGQHQFGREGRRTAGAGSNRSSAQGRFIAYESIALNLVRGDTNHKGEWLGVQPLHSDDLHE